MMTCKQLGGACDEEFVAGTFEEMAQLSKKHGTEMVKNQDRPHMDAMAKMNQLQQSPEALREWFEDKRRMFDALPEAETVG